MTFGEKLKALRKKLGLTQEKAAKAMGIGLRTYTYYEQDGRKPRNEKGWKNLADFYGVSVNYLKIDETIETIPEFNENSLVEVYNYQQRERERALKFVREYLEREKFFVQKGTNGTTLIAMKKTAGEDVVVLIRVGISSSDYEKKLKEIYGEFVSLKNVDIDIQWFWLVTNSKELVETANENPPIYLKVPLYVSLITNNSLELPVEVKVNSENEKENV